LTILTTEINNLYTLLDQNFGKCNKP